MARTHSNFKKGSGCYTCEDCGKRTRDTGMGEGSLGLCASCCELAGLENEHNDNHLEPVGGCQFCGEEN